METPIVRTRQASHPGFVLRELYMQPLGLTVTALAARIGVARKTLSKIVNERGRVEPYLALRLARVFNTTPLLWLHMQINYDLWLAEQKVQLETIEPIAMHL